jgi:cellulose synthase/poly-beta-1,6-N-acetylglucosamine synthase-like glycosyltransferase
MQRRIAIAIPARNEAACVVDCLERLDQLPADPRVIELRVVLLANNCTDDTAARAAAFGRGWGGCLDIRPVNLPPHHAHAGWARRLALDAAAESLRDPADVLMSTDADTLVGADWLANTLNHLDGGYDAVAGLARLIPRELRALPPRHRLRLAHIQRYESALDYLKAARDGAEPWPRHFYEGGASMALTLGAYRAAGGAPTPSVGEDKALFDAVRRTGGRVRHAMDVRVWTSARLHGRAPGGASDTLALWGRQANDVPIAGYPHLTFRELQAETVRARHLVAQARAAAGFAEAS